LAVFGYVLNRVFLLIEARLVRWHHESSGRI
jgi:ABC-type nitrate/sulfonate/bicarbonate transport system permease component